MNCLLKSFTKCTQDSLAGIDILRFGDFLALNLVFYDEENFMEIFLIKMEKRLMDWTKQKSFIFRNIPTKANFIPRKKKINHETFLHHRSFQASWHSFLRISINIQHHRLNSVWRKLIKSPQSSNYFSLCLFFFFSSLPN